MTWIDRVWFAFVRYSNGLEQFWTAIYAVGLVCGLAALWMATRDEEWQYVHGSGIIDRMWARKEIRGEKRTCYKLTLGLLAGIVQMTTPNLVPRPSRAGYVTTGCVAVMGLIMTYGSARNLLDRLSMRRQAHRIAAARQRRYTDAPPAEVNVK